MTIKALVFEEDGGYWAKVPSMPGCYTQGDTMEELVANLKEAIDLYLEPDPPVASSSEDDKSAHELSLLYTVEVVA